MKRVAVIGAGPAGMTAAYQISKQKDVEVTLFEISGSVGGLAKTITLWDQKVDIGPHRFFSSDSRVNEFWLEVVGDKYEMVDRMTRIFYNDRFFHYPLKPLDAFANLGVLETARCIFSYLKEKLSPTEFKGDFETWVTSRFTADRIKARRTHYEDWIAAIVFNHLFAGADAYVAANLWDFRTNIGVVATPRSGVIYASVRLR